MSSEKFHFYCTAGRGTEKFVSEELERLYFIEVSAIDGKVFFDAAGQCKNIIQNVLSLRSVERAFIRVLHLNTKDVIKGSEPVINHLERVLLKEDLWQQCLLIYHLTRSRDRTSECPVPPVVETEDNDKLMENTVSRPRAETNSVSETETHTTATKHKMTDTCTYNQASLAKQRKFDVKEHNSNISFRISCKCSGVISRKIQPRDISRRLGYKLSQVMGWRIDLRHPSMEICIHLNDENVVVGIPMTESPLSKRSYIHHCGLRSPVAWILCKLADIQPGDQVLDPLCGKATILIEGAKYWKEALYTGVDIDVHQLKCASDNVTCASVGNISLLHADVNSMPFKSHKFDVIICDLPFGQKHGEKSEMEVLYPHIMANMNRVLKSGGRVVLLTSVVLEKVLLKCSISPEEQTDRIVDEGKNLKEVKASDATLQTSDCASSKTFGDVTGDTPGDSTAENSSIIATQTSPVDSVATCIVKADRSRHNIHVVSTRTVSSVDWHANITISDQGNAQCAMNQGYPSETAITTRFQEKLPWQFLGSHYIKLGETHSRICVFQKE